LTTQETAGVNKPKGLALMAVTGYPKSTKVNTVSASLGALGQSLRPDLISHELA
jgi:hypothetical protein